MIYDAIVLGSGVAGLTAGLYLGRANKSVMIIENSVLGGTVASLETIENYPGMQHTSGEKLINGLISQVSELGVNIDFMTVTSIDFDKKCIYSGNNSFEYKTLIIATGTSYKPLKLQNASKFQFRGLSYCAVCDGRLYNGKNVVVVTDGLIGKSAIEYLSGLADNLSVVDISNNYHSTSDLVKVYSNSNIIEILGDKFVSGVRVRTEDGVVEIPCDGLFVSLGKATDISLFKDKLICENGHICSDENMHTNIEGVYVAGDVRVKSLRQIVTSASDGAIAGTEAIKYLTKMKD